MRKTLLAAVAVLFPTLSMASLAPRPSALDALANQSDFSTYSETSTMEWGCPVEDHIFASSQAEALEKIGEECLQEARRAAASKPEVMDVLQTKVVLPDVLVLKSSEGDSYQLSGTFFLETTVVQRTLAGVR